MATAATASASLPAIKRFGAGVLRRVAAEAAPGSEETRRLLDRMWQVLADDGGVGLAAPQIGVSQRVVVIRDPGQPGPRQRLDLVNPVITETSGPEVPFEEGCLSFPGLYTSIVRPRGVAVTYHDRDGNPQVLRDEGLVARIVQHEVDHLDGVLFIDHLSLPGKLACGPRLLLILASRLVGR